MALMDYAHPARLKHLIALIWSHASGHYTQGKSIRMRLRRNARHLFAAGILRAAAGFSRSPNAQTTISLVGQLGLTIANSLATNGEVTAREVTDWLLHEAGLVRRGSFTDWNKDYLAALGGQQLSELVQSMRKHWT